MPDQADERDDLTLRTLAIIEDTTVAEQRRRALHAYCEHARRDRNVAEIVRLMMASRRNRRLEIANVIPLRSSRA
jgi:hypothetical protein